MATCITPKPTISGEITHETQERETWFSDIPNNGGFAFTYKADSNQIAFLQMLSSKASQNVTYHCSNSVAHYHNRRQHHRKSIALQSWNDLEIRNRGKFRYNVIKDDCQVLNFFPEFFPDFYNFFFSVWTTWMEYLGIQCQRYQASKVTNRGRCRARRWQRQEKIQNWIGTRLLLLRQKRSQFDVNFHCQLRNNYYCLENMWLPHDFSIKIWGVKLYFELCDTLCSVME